MTHENADSGIDLDAHVHVYDVFDRAELLRTAAERGRSRGRTIVLALTESFGYRAFDRIRLQGVDGLDVCPTDDAEACAVEAGGRRVCVIAGRQLISREGLEVLALGAAPESPLGEIADGDEPAETLARHVLGAGALCVLPWSVGKWLGARGRLVSRLVEEPALRSSPRFFLGDIAARSWPWRRPSVFDRGVRVLCGTDPLPVPGAERGVGRYCSSVSGAWSEAAPWTSLRAMLETAERVGVAGDRDDVIRAAWDQIRLRMRRSR